jgi:hypothetical protein
MERVAAISVDLDSLPHYCRIHGLPDELLTSDQRQLIYTRALLRFGELFAKLGLPATYFAVGADLEDPVAAHALASARAGGVEIASHSFAHDYALTRRTPAEIFTDLARADAAISAAVGQKPRGFRAPGYTLTAPLYAAVCEQGYLYDSSVFPATPYYLAKALVMGGLALTGRPSRAVLDRPRVLGAPLEPYRPDPEEPYRRGAGSAIELPMAVTPLGRIPFIGTFAVTLPWPAVLWAYSRVRRELFLNFELHAVDLLDASDGIPSELVRRQRDLGVPWPTKRARMEELFRRLRDDYPLATLADAADSLAQQV